MIERVMKEMWDKRYANEEYVYGKEPNQFFKETLANFKIKGKLLFPAEGEGRNAVYGAKMGFSVFAFDISFQAKKKALLLAKNEKVNLQYEVGNITDLDIKPASFDAAILTFANIPPAVRIKFHREIAKLVKPHGFIILEAFSKNNYQNRINNPASGGPDKLESLFSIEDISNDFKEFEIIKLEEVKTFLKEGDLHNGWATVIRFIGKKKA